MSGVCTTGERHTCTLAGGSALADSHDNQLVAHTSLDLPRRDLGGWGWCLLVPELDVLVLNAINSTILEGELQGWVEHSVRSRPGEDLAPLLVAASHLISIPNPVVNFGIQARPATAVELAADRTGQLASAVKIGALVILTVEAFLYLAVRRPHGRSRSAMLTGLAGHLGACGLLMVHRWHTSTENGQP